VERDGERKREAIDENISIEFQSPTATSGGVLKQVPGWREPGNIQSSLIQPTCHSKDKSTS
jgi:hypothetical protein